MKLDLDRIEKRLNVATLGPWTARMNSTRESEVFHPGGCCVASAWQDGDADFIAHSREDIPALIARVRELEAALTQMKLAAQYGTSKQVFAIWEREVG